MSVQGRLGFRVEVRVSMAKLISVAREDFEQRRFGKAAHRLAAGFSRVLVLVSALAWSGCLRNGVRSLGV